MTCLGISVGTMRTGICVIKDGKLIERRVHTYPNTFTDDKAKTITDKYRDYIDKYRVTDIVVKIPPRSNQPKTVQLLLHRIKTIAGEYRCHYDLTNTFEMKSVAGKRTAEELIRYAVEQYPELQVLYARAVDTSFDRARKIFEAVLAAHLHIERCQKRRAQHHGN